MLPISVRPATILWCCSCNIAAIALVNDATVTVISVAVVFNDTAHANVAAVAVITLVALVNDAALKVVNVCCS